jgi:hypothetical protein
MGSFLLINTLNVTEITLRYDNTCTLGNTTCQVSFKPPTTMARPVYIYYRIDGMYQNHNRYMKSISPDQLMGNTPSLGDVSLSCDPILRMSDVGVNKSYTGVSFTSTSIVANPCGSIAKSFFTDNYTLYKNATTTTGTSTNVTIIQTGIAWNSDLKEKYSRPANSGSIQWHDPLDGNTFICSFCWIFMFIVTI